MKAWGQEESQMRVPQTAGQRGRGCGRVYLEKGVACAKVLGWEWPDVRFSVQPTCKESSGLATD